MSANILRSEPNAKRNNITKENIVKRSIKVERDRIYIPKVLCFILISRIFILKDRKNGRECQGSRCYRLFKISSPISLLNPL